MARVIATPSRVADVAASLTGAFGHDVGVGAAGLARPIALLTPQESKGLEFDSVIVVEPQEVIDEHSRGAAALYVAMTRATQRLHVVASERLPEGFPRPVGESH